jgi:hypothetical protein
MLGRPRCLFRLKSQVSVSESRDAAQHLNVHLSNLESDVQSLLGKRVPHRRVGDIMLHSYLLVMYLNARTT